MQKNNRVYIIAEIGVNHNGSLDNCYKLIDAARKAGCDCVKFQFFRAERLYPQDAGRLEWKDTHKNYSYDIYKAVKRYELPERWISSLMAYCAKNKIDFLSSIFDIQGLKLLVSYGVKQIKLPSYSVTNLPLIEKAAVYRLPLILSTGGALLGEIEAAVETVNKYHNKLSLLHCSIAYPVKLSECNLGLIKTLQYTFPDNVIGYSDHTKEIFQAAVQAVYLGAKIIEKHITLDRKMRGPDHFFALEPHQLKQMVWEVRRAQTVPLKKHRINTVIYGSTAKRIFPGEMYLRDFAFSRLFAKRYIKKGEVIRPSAIDILRPGKKKTGLEPKYLPLFAQNRITAKRALRSREPITWDSFLR